MTTKAVDEDKIQNEILKNDKNNEMKLIDDKVSQAEERYKTAIGSYTKMAKILQMDNHPSSLIRSRIEDTKDSHTKLEIERKTYHKLISHAKQDGKGPNCDCCSMVTMKSINKIIELSNDLIIDLNDIADLVCKYNNSQK
jgi:hypothetical protein